MCSLNKDEGVWVDIVFIFLGVYVLFDEYKECFDDYIDFLICELFLVIQWDLLVEFCDVFCEEGVFFIEQLCCLFIVVGDYGFLLKFYVDEIVFLGGVELVVELGVVFVDYLFYVFDVGIEVMVCKGVVVIFFLFIVFVLKEFYVWGCDMIDVGCVVVLVIDLNLGSCFFGFILLMFVLVCIYMQFIVEEVIMVFILNGVVVFNCVDFIGSIEVGKKGDFVVFDFDNYYIFFYYVGMNCVNMIIKGGMFYLFV